MIHALGMSALLALLGGAAAQEEGLHEVLIQNLDLKFTLHLPAGHVRKEGDGRETFHYQRMLGSGEWEWMRVFVIAEESALAQGETKTARGYFGKRELPPKVKLKRTSTTWEGFEIPTVEYTFIDEKRNLEIFGLLAIVPVTPRALAIDVAAAKEYEQRVRDEMSVIIGSVVAPTSWLTSDDELKLGLLIWPGLTACVLAVIYFILLVTRYRGNPWYAHTFRVIFQLAIGILFLSGFMLTVTFSEVLERSGQDPPVVCWLVVALPGTLVYVGLALRRIVLYIES